MLIKVKEGVKTNIGELPKKTEKEVKVSVTTQSKKKGNGKNKKDNK